MQIISGLNLSTYFCNYYLFMTDLIPFTFQEEINNFSGVLPLPYAHLDVLVFISPISPPPFYVLNCFDLFFIATGYGSYTFYFEKSFIWTYFFSFYPCSFPTDLFAFFGGIVKDFNILNQNTDKLQVLYIIC